MDRIISENVELYAPFNEENLKFNYSKLDRTGIRMLLP